MKDKHFSECGYEFGDLKRALPFTKENVRKPISFLES
jgi:hypothetical protein